MEFKSGLGAGLEVVKKVYCKGIEAIQLSSVLCWVDRRSVSRRKKQVGLRVGNRKICVGYAEVGMDEDKVTIKWRDGAKVQQSQRGRLLFIQTSEKETKQR